MFDLISTVSRKKSRFKTIRVKNQFIIKKKIKLIGNLSSKRVSKTSGAKLLVKEQRHETTDIISGHAVARKL